MGSFSCNKGVATNASEVQDLRLRCECLHHQEPGRKHQHHHRRGWWQRPEAMNSPFNHCWSNKLHITVSTIPYVLTNQVLYFYMGVLTVAEFHLRSYMESLYFKPSCRQLRSGWNYRFRVCLWLSFWKGKTQLLRFSVVKQRKHVKTDQSGIWKVLIWEVEFRTFTNCRCQMWIDNFSSYVIYCQRISSSRLGAEATPDLYLHNPEQGIGDLAGLGRFGTQGVSPTHCLRFVPSSCQAPVIKIYSSGNPIGFFYHRNIHLGTSNKTPFVMDFYDRSLASLGGHLWGRSLKSLKRCHPRKPKQLPTPRACQQAGGRVRFASHPFVRKESLWHLRHEVQEYPAEKWTLMKHSEEDLKKDMNRLEAFIFDEEFSERLWVDLVYIFSILWVWSNFSMFAKQVYPRL